MTSNYREISKYKYKMNRGEIDCSLEKDNASCSLMYQDENLKSNSSPKTEPQAMDQVNKQPTDKLSEVDENTKLQIDCLSSVSVPRNWSHIERLKSQRNKLQEMLSSQILQDNKNSRKDGNNKGFGSVSNISDSDCLKTNEDSDRSEEDLSDDELYSDSADQLFIADEEEDANDVTQQLNNIQQNFETAVSGSKSAYDASNAFVPNKTKVRSSKSMGTFRPCNSNEDLDLCELRVSNINHSLYEAFANTKVNLPRNKKRKIVNVKNNTKPKIESVNIDNCYRISKLEKDIEKHEIYSTDKNCSGKLKPSNKEKEKHLNKSHSDTNVLCKETGRKKAMRQKLKCFLQDKNRNDLLEKLFIKKMMKGKACLDSETSLGKNSNRGDAFKSEIVTKQQDESRNSSPNQSNIQDSDLVQSQQKEPYEMLDQRIKSQSDLDINEQKKSSIFTDTDDEFERDYDGDMEFMQSTKPNLYFIKRCENIKLQKELCSKQMQNLKIKKEYYKMKTKLLQKQSLCNYFKILEKRCEDKDVLAKKHGNYLRKSESCSDICPCVTDCNYHDSTEHPEIENEEKKIQSNVKEIEMRFHTHGSKMNEGEQKKSEKKELKIMSPLSTKLSSPKTSSRFPNITIIESPKLSSIKVTSPSSIIEKNMKSLLSKRVQQNDGTCETPEELNRRENTSHMSETIKDQSSSINNERGGSVGNNQLKSCQKITSAKVAYPVAKYPNPTMLLPGQQICLVEQATSQHMYAMIDKNFHPLYRVSKGVFCLPVNPGMPFRSFDTGVSTSPSVVYSGFGIPRPSIQLDNVTPASKPATAIVTEQQPVLPVKYHPIDVSSAETALLNTQMKSSSSQATLQGVMSISNVCQTHKPSTESKRTGNVQKNIAFHSDSPKFATIESKSKLTKQDESQVAGQKFLLSKHSEAQCQSELSIRRKVDENMHLSDKKMTQSIVTVKDHECPLVNTDKVVIDLDSESNDSFDSTDLESYQKLKKLVQTSSAYTNCENLSNCEGIKKTNGKTSDENALSFSLDSKFESVENLNSLAQSNASIKGNHDGEKAPGSCPLTQDSQHTKKYMKTKFIILKGEICDKWLDVKKKAGFAKVPDPNFVQYLLYMAETRQTDANACSKNLLAADRNDKTNTSGRSGFIETVIPEQNEKPETSDSQEPVKTPEKIAWSNAPKITEKKQAVKRPAEKKACVEDQSGPKKVRYDPSTTTTQTQLEKGRYDFLSKSVHKQMMWAVMVFKEWLKSQNEQDCHFESQGTVWLNMKLQQFYTEAHSMDDNTYLVKNLLNLRRFLSLYLEGHPESNCVHISIPLDPGFSTSNETLAEIMRQYKPGLSQETLETPPISPVDLGLLYTSNTLSDRNPVCLLSKVWFDISYHLCSSQFSETFLRSLKKHNLTLQSDINGVFYTFTDDICLPPDETLAKMYATPDVPERCPVRTTTVYLSKLCENCELLFQCPRAKWESSEHWYLPVPMSSEKLNGMMTKISTKAKLSTIYKTCNVFATAQHHRKGQ